MDLMSVGLLISSVLVVIFTFIQQMKQSEEAIAAKDDQIKRKDEIISEFKNLTTGGDSYLYLRPEKVSNTDEVLFAIQFHGKYPLYDATILLEEFDLKPAGANQYSFTKVEQKSITLGTVNPLQTSKLFEVVIPRPSSSNEQFGKKYFFKINSRNGMIEEEVVVRREGEHVSMAYKVVFFEPDYGGQFGTIGIKNIHRKIRHIDPMFPVHQLDDLDGDSGWRSKYETETGTGIR